MNKYLVNVTFYAGSDSKEDTDRGAYIIETEETLSYDRLKQAFINTNALCGVDWDEAETTEEIIENLTLEGLDEIAKLVEQHPNFQSAYTEGLNIDTLMDGLAEYLSCKIERISADDKNINVSTVYEIEQWQ